MKVRIDKSRKMPTLYSYYLTNFSTETLEKLKDSKPFACYWKDTQEYECTKEIFDKVKSNESVTFTTTSTMQNISRFKRTHNYKYGYQEDAVDFAMTTNNVFLNFPQGMGKSLTTMKIIDNRRFKRTLVICGQSNLQEEWLKDATKHNYRDKLNFAIIGEDTGASSTKKIAWLINNKDRAFAVDLINIEALRNVDVVYQLNTIEYDCIVVDEVQSAKGWKSQQTTGLHEIVRTPNQMRIALSGTPVLNNPLEFFSMLKYFGILDQTARTTFEKYYGTFGFDRWGHYICTGYQHLSELADLIRPVLCYVSKDELGLPPKTRKKITVKRIETERYKYLEKVYKMSTAKLKKLGFKSKAAVRAEMQFLSSTSQDKLDFILQTFNPNDKVLIFSQYTKVLDDYSLKLAAKGRKVLYYHGGLSMKARLSVLEDWHNGKADIMLLSIDAARYGLNLTEAPSTLFIEPADSLSVLEQAEDRSWRIGQTKPVTSYLLSGSQFDDDALENIVRKQEALDKINDFKNSYNSL